MHTQFIPKNSSTSRIEISRENLRHNLKVLAHKAGYGVRRMAVVKANAYGHGTELILPEISGECDWFGVASLEEGIEVRSMGIEIPVLVFAPVKAGLLDKYREFSLTATAGSIEEVQMVNSGTPFHLEFDTGMGRLGLYEEQIPEIISILDQKNLIPSGLMTHFSMADQPDSSYTKNQLKTWNRILDQLPDSWKKGLIHAANSGGLIHYPESRFSMVRHGIALYGYSPDGDESELKPVLSWKSEVVSCKFFRKGMRVSYEGAWTAEKDGWLIVIPAGYADGIPRQLSNKIELFADGRRIKQVGNVTMDYIMAFSDVPLVAGTEVELFGPNSMNANHWAEKSGTISYAILCGIHPKIERELV